MKGCTKPELLAPAGNLAKLKRACDYGADAVYIGGTRFGLRKAADNFSLYEMAKGIEYAHNTGKKVYVVLNGMAHQHDLENIITAITQLEQVKPDACIVSDPGVAHLLKEHSSIALHTSTQASILNWRAAAAWKQLGATRVVVGRELSLKECKHIHEKTGLEIEIFVHGSMCISHSGKCHISNYVAGRDSNRGGCIQSCRYRYSCTIDNKNISAHIMNARDLMAIELMPDIITHSISSLKIEGRMKSELYICTAVKNYRQAIDTCFESIASSSTFESTALQEELRGISNRGFTTGNLISTCDTDSINPLSAGYTRSTSFIGTVKEYSPIYGLAVEVRENILLGDTLECLNAHGTVNTITVTSITTLNGVPLKRATPNKLVWLASTCNPGKNALIRKQLQKPLVNT